MAERYARDALRSSLGVEAWEQAKKVSSSHVNAEVLRAVIKCCSHEACCVLERDKPLCPRAAHAASFCTAAAAEHGAGDDAVALDALAQRLRSVELSTDAAVLADMSAKLQKDVGVMVLEDLRGLSEKQMRDDLAALNLKNVQFNKLFKAVSDL